MLDIRQTVVRLCHIPLLHRQLTSVPLYDSAAAAKGPHCPPPLYETLCGQSGRRRQQCRSTHWIFLTGPARLHRPPAAGGA